MKRIVSFFIAAFAMLAISAGITSCDKDSIAVAKLLGTWTRFDLISIDRAMPLIQSMSCFKNSHLECGL